MINTVFNHVLDWRWHNARYMCYTCYGIVCPAYMYAVLCSVVCCAACCTAIKTLTLVICPCTFKLGLKTPLFKQRIIKLS